jgi:hypothetical protein
MTSWVSIVILLIIVLLFWRWYVDTYREPFDSPYSQYPRNYNIKNNLYLPFDSGTDADVYNRRGYIPDNYIFDFQPLYSDLPNYQPTYGSTYLERNYPYRWA